jgi:hypothetical protein
VTIDQRWAGVRRELELTRIDDCGDQTLPGDHVDDRSVVAQIRARLRLAPDSPALSPLPLSHGATPGGKKPNG